MDLREKLSSVPGSPRKVLKLVLGLSFILLLIWLLTLSYLDLGESPTSTQLPDHSQSVDSSLTTAASDTINTPAIQSQNTKEAPNLFTNGVIIFLVLAASLVLIWFWFERKGTSASQSVQREIDSLVVGEGAQIKIISINEEIWVLGITSESVNVLHRYSQTEWKEEPPEETSSTSKFATLFKGQL